MSSHSEPRFSAIIAALARPADVRALPLPAMHLVMAMRLSALFELAGREPIVELASRFASVTMAEQVLALTRLIDRSWPHAFVVSPPCCLRLSPDERTLANIARAAIGGDRAAFRREVDGFVRPAWHDPVYEQLAMTIAALYQLQQRA